MSNRTSNFPNAQPPKVKSGEMAAAIANQLELLSWERIDTSQPEQIQERLMEYFQWCIEKDHKPHVEEMALSLRVSRQALWNWQQQGGERGEVITLAKQILASMHESWGLNGKINPAAFCFLMKNHFGYADSVDVNQIPDETAADIAARHRIRPTEKPELPDGLID